MIAPFPCSGKCFQHQDEWVPRPRDPVACRIDPNVDCGEPQRAFGFQIPFDSSVCFDPNSLLPQVAHNQGLFSDQPVSFSSLWAVTRLVKEKHQKEAYYLNLSVAPSQFHEEPGPRDGGLISLHLSVMLLPVFALTLGLLFCPSIVTACFFSLSLLLCPLLQAEERMQSEVGYKAFVPAC